MRRRSPIGPAAALIAIAVAAGGFARLAAAAEVEAGGLLFSDREGGFELIGVSGTGTPDDPFVVVERIDGASDAILTIEGVGPGFGNRAGSNHYASFTVIKIVTNATEQDWPSFRMELQEHLGQPSDYHDGLSFGQEREARRVVESDRYARIRVFDEPNDGLYFEDGAVPAGGIGIFRFIITHNAPGLPIFLIQRRETPLSLNLEDGAWPTVN